MSVINRIKKIARDINGPIMERTASQAMVAQHVISKHKGLSIPTDDDEQFKAPGIKANSGHDKRPLDVPAEPNQSTDVSPANMPPVTDANDKTASAKAASMFHSLATKRGILKAKIASGENTTEAAHSLMAVHSRMANIAGLSDTIKRFEGKE